MDGAAEGGEGASAAQVAAPPPQATGHGDIERGDPEHGDPAGPAGASAEPEQEPVESVPVESEPVAPVAGAGAASDRAAPSTVPDARPRRACVRRGLVAAGVALVVALAVSAFATAAPTPASVDQRFVDAARSQGYVVAGDRQALVLSAARKICERRESHSSAAQRRATALSSAELDAVQQAFPDEARAFTTLALDTYCPS